MTRRLAAAFLAFGLIPAVAGCSDDPPVVANRKRQREDAEIARLKSPGQSPEEVEALTTLVRAKRQMGLLPRAGAVVKGQGRPPRGAGRKIPK